MNSCSLIFLIRGQGAGWMSSFRGLASLFLIMPDLTMVEGGADTPKEQTPPIRQKLKRKMIFLSGIKNHYTIKCRHEFKQCVKREPSFLGWKEKPILRSLLFKNCGWGKRMVVLGALYPFGAEKRKRKSRGFRLGDFFPCKCSRGYRPQKNLSPFSHRSLSFGTFSSNSGKFPFS